MKANEMIAARSRREFLRKAGCLGALLCLDPGGIFPVRKASPALGAETVPAFRCRTVSLRHIAELKEWMDKLDKEGRLSADKTWRSYVGSFRYAPPPSLAAARSLIVMATPLKIASIVFNVAGQKCTVLIPTGYVDDGMQLADYQDMLFKGGVVEKGRKLERAKLPLKQLAVRSGLAEYGRNNITFIDGYGSFHQLLAFYTDQSLEDHWDRLKLLRLCKGCSICRKECPTGAIRESDFVIDPSRCITLYNELPDPLPSWIPASAHNSLIGCLKCQYTCPGDEDVIHDRWDLGEVPEPETAALLSGRIDAKTGESLKVRFKRIGGGDDLAYIARNLKLVLDAAAAPLAAAKPMNGTARSTRWPRVLFLQNCPAEGFGRYVARLREMGIDHDIVAAYKDADLPQPDRYGAIIVGGTPVSVNEIQHHDRLLAEGRCLKKALDLGKPVLGICFGAQMLAKLLGAEVRKNPVMEIGAYPVHLTAAGRSDPVFQGFPKALPVFHWHGDTFDIPPWGLRLATGQDCSNQAFRMGSAVGLQFHLEVTAKEAGAWADAYPGELGLVAKSKARVVRECREHEVLMAELAVRLLDNFLNAAVE